MFPKKYKTLPGLDLEVTIQQLVAETDTGERIMLENDRVPLAVGDAFFGTFIETPEGRLYSVRDPDRRGVLIIVALLFTASIVAVGKFTGLRSLISLALSLYVISTFMLPLLASGTSALLVSAVSALAILALAMAITHGISWGTVAAYVASFVTIIFAVVLSQIFVTSARIAGFAGDESAILTLTTGGTINAEGLLLGAILIGILGIIDDLTVSQVATVQALDDANPTFSPRELYARAMHVGREHLGAVVNTLVLAYAGSALPLLLLFSLSPSSPLSLINSDIMATEVIRAGVGGIALALSLPIATLLAVLLKDRLRKKNGSSNVLHVHH